MLKCLWSEKFVSGFEQRTMAVACVAAGLGVVVVKQATIWQEHSLTTSSKSSVYYYSLWGINSQCLSCFSIFEEVESSVTIKVLSDDVCSWTCNFN